MDLMVSEQMVEMTILNEKGYQTKIYAFTFRIRDFHLAFTMKPHPINPSIEFYDFPTGFKLAEIFLSDVELYKDCTLNEDILIELVYDSFEKTIYPQLMAMNDKHIYMVNNEAHLNTREHFVCFFEEISHLFYI